MPFVDNITPVQCQAGEDVAEEAFKVMFKQHGAKFSLETLLVLSKARLHIIFPAFWLPGHGCEPT